MIRLLETAHPRALLIALCLLLWMPGFFSIPPGDRDESRFAQATKQMLETGDFVRILNGTEARNRKPIGIHWLQAPFVATADALGLAHRNPIWPYRIPSALGALLAVLSVFELGQALYDRRTGLLAAGLLAASLLLVVEVHIAKTDAALLGATTLTMAILGRSYLDPARLTRPLAALFWLAMGAGILLKGPITPMVAGLATLALVVADRRARRPGWLRALRPAWGIPLMLLVVLPWFVAIGTATHGRFFTDAVGGDLGRKLSSGDDAHGALPGAHLLLLPLLLFPATAALPTAAVAGWRTRREPATRFLLAWIIPAWLVFEATPTKLPHYTLPLYPAITLLIAAALLGRTVAWPRIGTVLAGIAITLLTAAVAAAPAILGLPFGPGLPAIAAVFLIGWFALRAWQPTAAIGAIVFAIPLYIATLGSELPRLTPLWIAPRVVAALPHGLTPARLGAVGFAEPSLMFEAGTNTQFYTADQGIAALSDRRVDDLLVGDRDLLAVQAGLAAANIPVRVVATIPGFNYSRGRRVLLTLLTRS